MGEASTRLNDITRKGDRLTAIAGKLPRFFVESGFLNDADREALLADSIACESEYEPTYVSQYHDGMVAHAVRNEKTRLSLKRKLKRRFKDLFRQGLDARKDRLRDAIGVEFPKDYQLEIEAVHSGDGAFFSRHIDTTRGDRTHHRVISAVYYYNRAPRGFTGGGLKLYSLDQQETAVVEPTDNTMVFFPSIFFHEVLPVSVPSGQFAAGRFSVNCWVNRIE